jgi:hypothetical protein
MLVWCVVLQLLNDNDACLSVGSTFYDQRFGAD